MFEEDMQCPNCNMVKVMYYPNPEIGIDCHHCDITFTWSELGYTDEEKCS